MNIAIAAAVAFGLFMHIQVFRERPATAICGADFPIFYGSAKLLGTPDLYSPAAVQRMQRQEIGCGSAAAAFIRLPYFAALVRPLTLLPVGTAFAVWRGLLIIAELGFVAFFRRQWKWALLACVWSWPLAWDLDNGQDASFLLPALMAGAFLMARGRPFAAGLCFSWCAAKPHLVVLLPLLLIAQNLRRTAAGLATGGAVWLAVSFAVAGWGWPSRFLHAIANPAIDPTPMELHNIRGLVHGWLPAEIFLGLTVAAAVWMVCRSAKFEIALSAVLAGSLLVCHHLTASDWCMLLPVGLMVGARATMPVRVAAIALITPVVFLLQNNSVFTRVPDLLLLFLTYGMACEAWRLPRFASVEYSS
ncbi:MAG TPA: glycosyltransferase family 87 protein [Candidatus Sulfopaludibacter sp.]|nr:glycosyltransferase family 87 protein [Candidatus Sulfopaludibacter sp.]